MSFFDKFIKKNIMKNEGKCSLPERLEGDLRKLITKNNQHLHNMGSSTVYVPTEDEAVSHMSSEEAEEYLKKVKEEREKEIEQLNRRIESIETAVSKKTLDEI